MDIHEWANKLHVSEVQIFLEDHKNFLYKLRILTNVKLKVEYRPNFWGLLRISELYWFVFTKTTTVQWQTGGTSLGKRISFWQCTHLFWHGMLLNHNRIKVSLKLNLKKKIKKLSSNFYSILRRLKIWNISSETGGLKKFKCVSRKTPLCQSKLVTPSIKYNLFFY